MTHPSIAGRVTTDWREDDVGGEGGAIVAKDGKTPKVFCNSHSVAQPIILYLNVCAFLSSFCLYLYHVCVYVYLAGRNTFHAVRGKCEKLSFRIFPK